MCKAILCTGGNIGDTASVMQTCNRMIEKVVGTIVRRSEVVETKPWGFKAGQNFLNQVVEIETTLSPEQLLDALQRIEIALGRANKTRVENGSAMYSSRVIDIDILLYDQQIIKSERLTIPHPLMQERDFVLDPLCQIESDYVHPVFGVSIRELQSRLHERKNCARTAI